MGRLLGNRKSSATAKVRRVVWSDHALDEPVRIRDYLTEFSPATARRFVMRLRSAAESLDQFAERGRPTNDGARELVIVRPYTIRYVVEADRVEVVDIRHMARRPFR